MPKDNLTYKTGNGIGCPKTSKETYKTQMTFLNVGTFKKVIFLEMNVADLYFSAKENQ